MCHHNGAADEYGQRECGFVRYEDPNPIQKRMHPLRACWKARQWPLALAGCSRQHAIENPVSQLGANAVLVHPPTDKHRSDAAKVGVEIAVKTGAADVARCLWMGRLH